MVIVCPTCASQYTIDPARVGACGRTVRCAACRNTWFAGGPEASASDPPGPAGEDDSPAEPGRPSDSNPISVAATTGSAFGPGPRRALGRRGRGSVARVPRSAFLQGRGAALVGLVLLAALGAIVAGRSEIIRALPQTARLYAAVGLPVNLRGLAFSGVKAETVAGEGGGALQVEATIANLRTTENDVPAVEIAIRGADGQPLYTWTVEPPRASLAGADSIPLRARLASPPPEGREVSLQFVRERKDAHASAAGAP